MRSTTAMMMLWCGAVLNCAHAANQRESIEGWDHVAPVVVAELTHIVTQSDATRDVWQRRGEWLLEAMGEKSPKSSLSALAYAEKIYSLKYRDKTPVQLATALSVSLPSGFDMWNQPMGELRNNEAFIQPLTDCMSNGDPLQVAVCHLLLIDVVTAQYQSDEEIKAVAYPELLAENKHLLTIIDLAINVEQGLDGGGALRLGSKSPDLPLNVVLAKRALLGASKELLKITAQPHK